MIKPKLITLAFIVTGLPVNNTSFSARYSKDVKTVSPSTIALKIKMPSEGAPRECKGGGGRCISKLIYPH